MYSRYETAIKNYIFQIFPFSGLLWVHIAIFETTLRVSVNEALAKIYGRKDWWETKGLLRRRELEKINFYARFSSLRASRDTHFINQSTLGFWASLFTRNYHKRIWLPVVEEMPSLKKVERRAFLKKLNRIKSLRDSIAHHVPILERNVMKDLAYLHELTLLLSPIMSEEIQKSSAEIRVLYRNLTRNKNLGSGGGI